MDGYGASTYGDSFAEVYDRWYPDVSDTAACVALLVSLAHQTDDRPHDARPDAALGDDIGADLPSAVLELGIGTGRIGLPLAEAGLSVTGVDASTEMLEALAAKPGADRVTVVVGDMAELDRLLPPPATVQGDQPDQGRQFDLAFAAYNTLFNLPTVEAQRACVRAVADRLVGGGRLVVEGFVPADGSDTDPPDGSAGRRDDVAVSRIAAGELVLTATVHDRDAQTITGQHVHITDAGIRLRPWLVRYLRPAQLDQIATSAGLTLEHRWADWRQAPFDDTSPVHVSVYRRAL